MNFMSLFIMEAESNKIGFTYYYIKIVYNDSLISLSGPKLICYIVFKRHKYILYMNTLILIALRKCSLYLIPSLNRKISVLNASRRMTSSLNRTYGTVRMDSAKNTDM